ncbi:MAG TPA: hypothetical protein VJU82_01475, partial [Acidobacteriaceae bacterium]|nr:hypothetical protein [Acidobacteriaceae bacterium]
MNPHAFEFATRSALIRQALAAHQPWIEQKLGVPISDAVIFDSIGNLSQVGLDKLLALTDIRETGSREQRRLRPFVAEAEVPPRYPPILRLRHEVAGRRSLAALLDDREERFSGLDWADCPIAFRLHYYNLTIVTLNVPYQSGPQSHGESVARLLVARRDCAAKTVELIKLLYRRSRTPRLCMLNAKSRAIPHVEWDDLVIDTNVTNLLKNDFESFGERERWFRQRKLPFRRGYLLHGPPGNG